VVALVRLMLKAAVVMPDGTKIIVREGTPQGGPLSPLLSNIVLDELDWELARRGHRFVRYADDCNVFVGSVRAGARVMASITKFLERRMRLQVNAEKSAVRHPSKAQGALPGLPLSAAPGRRDRRPVVGENGTAASGHHQADDAPNWGRSITACLDDLSRYLTGWMAHYRLCSVDAIKGLGVLDAHIRRRIRAIIVRQKKRPRFLLRHLLRSGWADRPLPAPRTADEGHGIAPTGRP